MQTATTKKKTYCINLQVPHHRQCAKHTQDTRGTSSALPLYTRQVWDKFSFTTTHKCGTSSPLPKTKVGQVLFYHHTQDKCRSSSPLPPHTRQVWDKLLLLLIAFIYIKFSFSLYHRTRLQDKFSFTITHKTKAGHVLFYHLFICYCSTCSTHRWLTIYPLTTYSTVTSAHQ